jgi:hypothetical protein
MPVTLAKIADADYTNANKRVRYRTVTLTSSYPTGGEALVASDVGLHKITSALPEGAFVKTDRTDGVLVHYSIAAGKLTAYQSTTGAPVKLVEVANATDLSAYSGRIRFEGF